MRSIFVLCACAAACALTAGPALANGSEMAGSSIQVSVPPVKEGHPLQITVSGSNLEQTGAFGGMGFFIALYFVDPQKVPYPHPGPCLPGRSAESSLVFGNAAYATQITGTPIDVGQGGPFKVTVPYGNIRGTGPVLICAYDDYAGGNDAAWASAMTKILPGPKGTSTSSKTTPAGGTPTQGAPKATAKPHVSRAGKELFCERGNWSGHPQLYGYKWTVVHKQGVAGKRSSLPVKAALRGHQVECSVIAANSHGTSTATSNPFKVK